MDELVAEVCAVTGAAVTVNVRFDLGICSDCLQGILRRIFTSQCCDIALLETINDWGLVVVMVWKVFYSG